MSFNIGPKTSIQRDSDIITEHWEKGFVIWQVYNKNTFSTIALTRTITAYSGGSNSNTLTFGDSTSNHAEYFKDDYQFTEIHQMPGTFLYADRKTIVKNKVILAVKR